MIIKIPVGEIEFEADLTIPEDSKNLVIFSHGITGSRNSPRNNFIAKTLQKKKIATLLVDLLLLDESFNYKNKFDIDKISERLVEVTKWIEKNPSTSKFKLGYFGASTGSAAAIMASLQLDNHIQAIVSRAGRPDLVIEQISQLKSPILFVVGSKDTEILDWNKKAFDQTTAIKKLEIIKGATHQFEEEGALKIVADLSAKWFLEYLK